MRSTLTGSCLAAIRFEPIEPRHDLVVAGQFTPRHLSREDLAKRLKCPPRLDGRRVWQPVSEEFPFEMIEFVLHYA